MCSHLQTWQATRSQEKLASYRIPVMFFFSLFFYCVNFSTTRSRSTASWLQWNKLREFWGRTLVVWFDLHFIKRGFLILQYSIINIQNLIGFSDIFKITNIQTTSYMCIFDNRIQWSVLPAVDPTWRQGFSWSWIIQ